MATKAVTSFTHSSFTYSAIPCWTSTLHQALNYSPTPSPRRLREESNHSPAFRWMEELTTVRGRHSRR